MARETKEQKQERLALEEMERELAQRKFREELPKRLFEAKALAQSLGIDVVVSLNENGPLVEFLDCKLYGHQFYYETYNYFSEEWQIETLESRLLELKTLKDQFENRRNLAQAIFDKLSAEEKVAIKEHIYSLR